MDYRILPVGDSALTILFGDQIDPEISRIVRTARKYLTKLNIEGVSEYVQTYASLMVHYRPVVIGYEELADRITEELSGMDIESGPAVRKTILIPVCYGGEFGPDLLSGHVRHDLDLTTGGVLSGVAYWHQISFEQAHCVGVSTLAQRGQSVVDLGEERLCGGFVEVELLGGDRLALREHQRCIGG